jgi:DNA-binding transcriptional regulator YhcF (GntR family)
MTFRENKPIYLQIAEQIMDKVERSELPVGERIPSVREYAAGVGVNPNTVMRSYDWLEQSGLIFNRRGIGFFVTDDAQTRIVNMRKEEFFKNEMGYFLERLRLFGISLDELCRLYNAHLDKAE